MRLMMVIGLLLSTVACAPSEPAETFENTGRQDLEPAVRFVAVSAQRGLDFSFQDDHSEARRMFETIGGGVVAIDYDGNGVDDLFFPGGGSNVASDAPVTHQGLFRNDGAGFFTDVTESMGLGNVNGDYATGGATADIDGDGDLDLFVTCLGQNRLYRNDGDSFSEIPNGGGAGGSDWSAGAFFFDADGDGDYDLFVVNYVEWNPDDQLPCTLGGIRIYCTPDLFEASDDRFYRNEDGSFFDATETAGLIGLAGKGLAAMGADFDDDGDIDIYVANDSTPNFMLFNDGHGRFVDEGFERGSALGRNGLEEASMGVVVADFDNDLDADLVVTNFANEAFDFFRNDHGGFYTEVSDRIGLLSPSWQALGFGIATPDIDLDCHQDLVFACGHINDLADQLEVGSGYRQPNLVLRNNGGSFRSWEEASGDLGRPDVARGLIATDVDGDGDEDLVSSRLGAPVQLLVNQGTPSPDAWIAIRPQDSRGSPAWGASAILEMNDGRRFRRWLAAGGSFASSGEPVLRFGLNQPGEPLRLTVVYPGRPPMTIERPTPGKVYTMRYKD